MAVENQNNMPPLARHRCGLYPIVMCGMIDNRTTVTVGWRGMEGLPLYTLRMLEVAWGLVLKVPVFLLTL